MISTSRKICAICRSPKSHRPTLRGPASHGTEREEFTHDLKRAPVLKFLFFKIGYISSAVLFSAVGRGRARDIGALTNP